VSILDKETNIQTLKQKVRDFAEARDWDEFHNAKDLAIGIITESSELLEHFRFKNEKEVEELFFASESRKEISEEMADVMIFLLRLADKYEIDISEETLKKLEKNEKRFPAKG